MENKYKTAYHITKKANLLNIQKNGLEPRIGRRSNNVNEYNKLLCFTTSLRAICIWKERLYGEVPFDDLAILSFELENIQYGQRYDSAGDFFTTTKILPENIRVIQIVEKGKIQTPVSLENLSQYVLHDEKYQVIECNIRELKLEQVSKEKEKIIDELAAYEHKKWSECQDIIHWCGDSKSDGTIQIAPQHIEQIQKYGKLDYDKADEVYKKEIRKTVLETFYIMQENGLLNQLNISDEDILSILERTEYNRRNSWNEYMLSLCIFNDGKYTIPKERVEWWNDEIRTSYYELSENLKEYDRVEVYNIFSEIEKYKNEKSKIETPSIQEDDIRE